MKFRHSLFAVLSGSLAACASAPAPEPAAPAATMAVAEAAPAPTKVAATTQQTGPNGEPLICRRMKVTGTRFAQKECKTAEAWAQYDEYTKSNAREATDKVQRLNSGPAAGAGG